MQIIIDMILESGARGIDLSLYLIQPIMVTMMVTMMAMWQVYWQALSLSKYA